MWHKLAEFILKFKVYCLAFLLVITIVMGYFAAQVKLSYEFTKAIPDDNPKFVIYKDFVKNESTGLSGYTTDVKKDNVLTLRIQYTFNKYQ